MTRRLGFASLLVALLALSGASVEATRTTLCTRLVVSLAWSRLERLQRPAGNPVRRARRATAVPANLLPADHLESTTFLRWLFQRPPPRATALLQPA